jgi:hypothetical protein
VKCVDDVTILIENLFNGIRRLTNISFLHFDGGKEINPSINPTRTVAIHYAKNRNLNGLAKLHLQKRDPANQCRQVPWTEVRTGLVRINSWRTGTGGCILDKHCGCKTDGATVNWPEVKYKIRNAKLCKLQRMAALESQRQ